MKYITIIWLFSSETKKPASQRALYMKISKNEWGKITTNNMYFYPLKLIYG